MDRHQLLADLITGYGKRGLDSWSKVSNSKRRSLAIRLGWPIADHDTHVRTSIYNKFDADKKEDYRFIPLPCDSNQLEYVFFLPMRKNGDGSLYAFDLFIVVNDQDCLGLRWEPADGPDESGVESMHCYGHVQFCKRMANKQAETLGVPLWIPDSWPAIPLRTSEPILLFLSLITSIRGYGSHLFADVGQIFPEGNMRRICIDFWKEHLGIS